ncbi:putative B3 domain-containing protein At5g58280 [Euphorbia lathyris]|uniref:putative B3 domain-containing protein At5g58280 n=1 Tax=Euphorbia lathyris TaxID=212925 RepID=UPI003313D0CA
MAVDNAPSNTYEEARKQRLDENKKRFQDLGITDISKSLSKLSTPEKKARQRLLKSKEVVEPRRSARARAAISYRDDVDIDLPPVRKKTRFSSSSCGRYAERQLDEFKVAAYEDRIQALKAAEEFQINLQSGKPSFVKSMLRSHVYKGFWLGLPAEFCKDHLPKKDLDMILEDENGSTYDARYLGNKNGLSGGWRGFALDHKIDDGDAVVFELVDSDKFKLNIFRAPSPLSSETQVDVAEEEGSAKATNASEDQNKLKPHSKQNSKKVKASKVSNHEISKPQNKSESEVISCDMNSSEKNGVIEENDGKDESLAVKTEVESLEENGKQKKHVVKSRKKPAPRLFRRRA